MANQHKTVLITGATSGIGFELAWLFAKDNYNMVIVARNEEALKKVDEDLKTQGAGKVYTIAKDLSIAGTPDEIYKETIEKGIQVDILVNNAGVGEHGFFHETDLEKELKIIQLNIAALVHLTKLYLKDMVKRDDGKILQLASVASYQPTPKLAVYAATKAFVLSFTDALINELEGTGVTMTALIPGATATDFFRKANMENTKAAQENPEDPAVVAKVGYEAMMKGHHHAVAPGVQAQIALSSILPNENVTAMARKSMEETH